MYSIQEIAEEKTKGCLPEGDKAISLHDYVRDHVKFGFNKYFDDAPPEYTLKCRMGHCNPKSRLMTSLFRAIGLESFQHFVVIPKAILKDAIAPAGYIIIPTEISHSYVEVKVDGNWCAIDSFVIDTPYLKAAQAKLKREGHIIGYGVRADSTNIWDGRSNAFSQFQKGVMVEDHGRIDNLDAYFRSSKYRQRVFGLRFNTMFQLIGDHGLVVINSRINKIRKLGVEQI